MQLDFVYGADEGQVETPLVDAAHKGGVAVAVDKPVEIVPPPGQGVDAGRPYLIAGGFLCGGCFHGPVLSVGRGV